MLKFMRPILEQTKNGNFIVPVFKFGRELGIMIRGGDFYAVYDEETGMWSTDWFRLLELIDADLYAYRDELAAEGTNATVKAVGDTLGKSVDILVHYLKTSEDYFVPLDQQLTFLDDEVSEKDFRSRRLPYRLSDGPTMAWDKLMGTLYNPEDLDKLVWAIGSIIAGDSINIQKFIVLYGDPGSGKSTFLNILQGMFPGYWAAFSSQNLGQRSDAFSLEPFKDNPLLGIEHDGDLSRVEDNTRLNSLVSHEVMLMNEKFKARYSMRFNTFLFLATNKPVKITDAKSGLMRRVMDVYPSGNTVPFNEYVDAMNHVQFEYGSIAKKCLDSYLADPNRHDADVPWRFMEMTNPFYEFMFEKYDLFSENEYVTLKLIWDNYKQYADEAEIQYRLSMQQVKAEAMDYYYEFYDRKMISGVPHRNVYMGFRKDKFLKRNPSQIQNFDSDDYNSQFLFDDSILDRYCESWKAQYTLTEEEEKAGKHMQYWENVTTTVKDINTGREHMIRPPEGQTSNLIMIDFDCRNENEEKDFNKSYEASRKFPPTYGELSRSGKAIHLYYIYEGDIEKLDRCMPDDPQIEIKTLKGKSSFRRKLTKCNRLPIATITGGLPLRKENTVVNFDAIKDERHLRNIILKHLKKQIVSSTSQSMSLMMATLDEAYNAGLHYDVTDLRPSVLAFAANSTNHPRECIAMMKNFKWKSDEPSDMSQAVYDDDTIIFWDVEVYRNLFVVVWMYDSDDAEPVIMINPSSLDIEPLFEHKLVGFNNRRYDNHIMYARHLGYNNEQLFMLSQRIINGSRNAMFSEAYNLSYTDIYDFASKKQSLKKWEIELSIHHQEAAIPWDQDVPEDRIMEIADYCCNDVRATRAVFHHLKADWEARLILATIAGMTPNDTTNTLTGRIIFGSDRHPHGNFIWRNMAMPVQSIDPDVEAFLKAETCLPFEFIPQQFGGMLNEKGIESVSKLPYFPGYAYQSGKSMYRGEDVGNGGYVYAEPGIHWNVALLDIASMHPSSAILECIFGPKYTKRFKDIKDLRVYVKHNDLEAIKQMWDGILVQFIQDPSMMKALAYALKIAINSVYGLTSAVFENLFRDPNNIDNIVAKRGALFMVDLKHAVQELGFQVAHIKTDSIKIPNATPEIIQFVIDMGHYYGYDFEHEATYDKMALVNNAVYICKHDGKWDPTGTQFAVPYVFKTLFSKEAIAFGDLCETRQVKVGSIYLDFNEQLPDVSASQKLLDNISKKLKDNPDDGELLTKRTELEQEISIGHEYQFIGRIGLFCPMLPGHGGAEMVCIKDDGSISAVAGTKGYRWLESETVKANHLEEFIDYSYYNELVDKAVEAISVYGDVSAFLD